MSRLIETAMNSEQFFNIVRKPPGIIFSITSAIVKQTTSRQPFWSIDGTRLAQ